MREFNYDEAFSRNIGWVTQQEQHQLRDAVIACAGLGGVGGDHMIDLARLGVGHFRISDMDDYDLANFNRQAGASMQTIGRPKSEVMEEMIRGINPEATVTNYKNGITLDNVEEFLDGATVYVDSLDIFAVDIRRKVFQTCYEKGIPAITAAPMGMGTSMLCFMPGQMSFEDYFCLEGFEQEEQIIRFVVGVSPSLQQRHYLVEKTSVNFTKEESKVPSTRMGISMAAGVLCTNVLKLILGRGEVICAPRGMHFDAYRNKLIKTWRPGGNKNPRQRFMIWYLRRLLKDKK
ncbi:ThiF family adenylyltransferase [Alteromonas oceanisediminis]|uniref:ThiF family adenylyltransferase n=1 Tax=Alteromonas oceanisediminis TaxID=2836180 RepID=UPI001BD9E2CC|nr:ThiF family adenylyltransferase [Alteromonas oceanisediminis]MBT0585690.1 ThiF family adenylyltransferase [Alteromonas oceanisediminis]